MKNIDKIRQMTADELAEFICNPCQLCNGCCKNSTNCQDGLVNWLEQEVEE